MTPKRLGADAERSGARNSWPDKAFFGAFLAGLVTVAFVAGALLTAAGVFPGPHLARAYQGGKALHDKLTAYQDVYLSDLWHPARYPDRGVTVHDPARVQDGVTLYTSGHEAAAYLVSMDGDVLHEWRRPFSTVWDDRAQVKRPQPDSHVFFRKAVVYPNGDLLAVYEGVGDTPYGYGVVKLDRNSEVLWTYWGRAHHDLDIGPDGRIYALTHELVDQPLAGFDNLASPRLDDFLVVLSPEGEELQKIPLIHKVAASEYRHLLHTVSSYAIADPLHANTVSLITDEVAARFAFGQAGQVLLSFRELGAIGVLDVASERLVWATRGPWLGQHDPDVLPNGHVLLFDNYGHYERPEGPSRVIEFDPLTMEIVWQYAGSAEWPFASAIRSSQQRLANGNTLITESNGGRILEVTPAGE
ncbi:MAG TPA: arylsulfotransferase family protein, partial [Vicinamibacterales bacterium]|nr:arylsulfotransferase family protein [Vicinamibacterales bacterium]